MASKKFPPLLLALILSGASIPWPTSLAQAQQSALARPWVGIVLGEPDAKDGVAVETVLRRSPAHRAGLKDGDRVLTVNAQTVRTPGKLNNLLGSEPIGRKVVLEVQRDEERLEFEITLEVAPSSQEVHRLHLNGFPTPQVELKSLDGDTIKLAQYNERPLLLEFWATWCVVCRRVTRLVEGVQKEHPNRFDVLAITAEDRATITKYLETSPMKLPIALDLKNQAHGAFLANSYPHVVLIDADGTIQNVATTVEQVEQILSDLLISDKDKEVDQ